MFKHLNIRIFGKVQGVFFRDSVSKAADKLGLRGFVKNEDDGSVYIEAEGDEKSLDEFLDQCRQGTDFSKVEKVQVKEGEMRNFTSFQVSY